MLTKLASAEGDALRDEHFFSVYEALRAASATEQYLTKHAQSAGLSLTGLRILLWLQERGGSAACPLRSTGRQQHRRKESGGGNGAVSSPGRARLQRCGLGFRFPPVGTAKRRAPRNIPKGSPEFPREIIRQIDKRGPETDFPTASGPLPNNRETGRGVNFFGRKIPPQ